MRRRKELELPAIEGFSHVSLSVRDLDVSTAFYADIFGFVVFDKVEDEEAYREHVMLHPSGAILCLQNHRANAGEGFEPQRTGMDHLAFRVATRAELDDWVTLLKERGIRHSPIVDARYGSVLCVRDPDDIQLEIFYRENHP
jgi:glyoxylase I family protein